MGVAGQKKSFVAVDPREEKNCFGWFFGVDGQRSRKEDKIIHFTVLFTFTFISFYFILLDFILFYLNK